MVFPKSYAINFSLSTEPKQEDEFPKEKIVDLLEQVRPLLSTDVNTLEKKVRTSLGFYETCKKMFDGADDALKTAFR